MNIAEAFVSDVRKGTTPSSGSSNTEDLISQFQSHCLFKKTILDMASALHDQFALLREFGTTMAASLGQHKIDAQISLVRSNASEIGALMDDVQAIQCGTCGGGGEQKDEPEDIESAFDLSGLMIDAELIGRNWIKGAIKHPGAFRAAASRADKGRFKGKTASFAAHVVANTDKKHGGSHMQHMARLAQTLAKLRKRKGK